MRIGAIQPLSLIDYPDHISAIIFTIGCNFRCRFCHNPELVESELFPDDIPVEDIMSFLEKRKNQLDGVVVTGGEPLIQKDISSFLSSIKDLGYDIKLDTNGYYPIDLNYIVNNNLVDYIAMDIKAPLSKYQSIVNYHKNVNTGRVLHSIDVILHSNIDHEFRTTVCKSLLSLGDLVKISEIIKGAKLYAIQHFRYSGKILDSSLINDTSYSENEIRSIIPSLLKNVKRVIVR